MKPVEVWYVRTDDVAGDELVRSCERVLAAEELERCRAFFSRRDRHEHLVTRALARGVLGRALDVPPASLSFCRNAFGRPELKPSTDWRFNLTNTTALVACAVARGREVGVDAEAVTRADEILDVAHLVFTEGELERMAHLEAAARRQRALELWTAKEAYIKARGLGFSLSPTKIELDVRNDGIGLRFLEDVGDDPTRWIVLARSIEEHVLALCVERSGDGEDELFVRRANLGELLRKRTGLPRASGVGGD
ncbi:MAG TPA: 4'-phosphopantetheinyl transferase superfamily protein [Polyangiaceae bacterium]|nr:4'-phosphopantetheinyl transferase superfamily protein [Polyangiaceae bacterium]